MEADLARRRWNNFVIIAGESLQAPVGHLEGDQIFFLKNFYRLPKAIGPHPCDEPDSSLTNENLSPNRCKRAVGSTRKYIHGNWRKSEDIFPLSFPL
jgi:hypothetical protein